MTDQLSHGASSSMRRFAGSIARRAVGHPTLEGINYWDELKDSPSQMEIAFAIFANVPQLDEAGEPVNQKYAETRAAVWLFRYCAGSWPPGAASPLEPWEAELY